MDLSTDYKDLFKILNDFKVKYIVVGAYATIYYSKPRFTKDLDIWVENSAVNAEKTFNALKKFGAPLKNITAGDFTCTDIIYQVGSAPIRIDIMTGITGVDFASAWKHKKRTMFGNTPINLIDIKDLIRNKEKTNREQDKIDLRYLKKYKKA